ncbi:S41 family peptidase [Leptospira perdikensis]|uniref:PDZ domain-containing protein n=1 Tax=Leptospira perdikensis TaxID=2484948 RepID=A0A4R9JJ76_9LEPT|nr:S41 family peptidase [Leptospira perdikensis]TGL41357.1 PDZ domain-containing protein [Leptospira perdikensis]
MKLNFTNSRIIFSIQISLLSILLSCQSPKPIPLTEKFPIEAEKIYQHSKRISAIKKQMEFSYLYPKDLNNSKAFQRAAVLATESFENHILLPKSFYVKFQNSIQGVIIQDGVLSNLIIIQNPNLENKVMLSDSVASQLEDEFTKITFTQDLLESVLQVLYTEKTNDTNWENIIYAASEGYVSSFLGSSIMILEKYEVLLQPKTIISIDIPLKETNSKRKIITSLQDTSFLKNVGLQNNDELLAINDKPVRYLSIQTINHLLKGKIGSTIKVDVQRNQKYSIEIPIKENKSTEQKMIEGQIWTGKYNFIYIKVSGFLKNNQSSATNLIKENYFTLVEEAKNKNIIIHGFVFDLRNNSGGYFDQIIECMRMFVPNGLLVTTQTHKGPPNMVYANQSTITDLPMTILINGNTGSGSELIAGVIQHYQRGIILGSKSTGQGLVHTLNKVSGEDSLLIKITSSFLYLPNGKKFHESGITPDIWVSDQKELNPNFLDAKNHIQADSAGDSKEKNPKLDISSINQWIEQNGSASLKIKSEKDKNILPDYQLYHSLDFFSGYLATKKIE